MWQRLALGRFAINLTQELQPFDLRVSLLALPDDLPVEPVEHVEHREQRGRAVALAAVALAAVALAAMRIVCARPFFIGKPGCVRSKPWT